MKVYLDETPLPDAPTSVADALVAGRDAAEAAGRLVVEVHADGEPIDPALLDAPPDSDAGIAELRLVSTAPGPFLRATLLDAAALLTEIRKTQALAVEKFQTGHIEDAVPALQNALGSWTLVRDVVEKTAALSSVNPSAVIVETGDGTRTGATYIDSLAADFDAVRRALEVQDFTALADVLESDLDARADQWVAFVSALARAVSPDDTN